MACARGSGIITTIAGSGARGADDTLGYEAAGDGGPATQALLDLPLDVALDPSGSLYILEHAAHPPRFNPGRVRKVDPSGRISTVVGPPTEGATAASGEAAKLQLKAPVAMALDSDGSLYVGGALDYQVVRVDPSGRVTAVAGTGKEGFSGDGGPAVEAKIGLVTGMALDDKGNLYFSEESNHRIRKVDPAGMITTFAGTGKAGFSGDGGPADRARIRKPQEIAVDKQGNVYFADFGNGRIRRIDRSGIIQTVAGGGKGPGRGDGGPATRATISPIAVWVAEDGRLYIGEQNRHRIRMVDPAGVITTVAGSGEQGFFGDGGPATEAGFDFPSGMAVGPDGALYVADFENARVRKVCL